MNGGFNYGYPYNLSKANNPVANPVNPGLPINCISTEVESLGKVWDADLRQNIPILKVKNKNGFFYTSKMAIDADGDYRAYHPNDICGLDSLDHAYYQGKAYGLVIDKSGKPVIQKDTDPAPGFYISPTTLYDRNKAPDDPRAYAYSQRIPYFVLPVAEGLNNFYGAGPGDFGVVINNSNYQMSYAICGDIYPLTDRIGEGSMALADSLGINNNPRLGGLFERKILYIVFPKSGAGNGQLRTIEAIVENGEMNFEAWGGMAQVKALRNYI